MTRSAPADISIRVAQVIYSFEVGGSEMVARALALGMIRRGLSAAVWGLEGEGILRRELETEGVVTNVIARRPGEFLAPMRRVLSQLQVFQPDVVHTHHLHQLIYSLGGARIAGVPVIHTEHETHSLRTSKARRRLEFLSGFCEAVTGVSEEVVRFMETVVGIPAKKLRVIQTGIDLDDFPAFDPSDLPRRVGSGPVLGSVSRLTPLKDHATMLRAFQLLQARMPDARLMLVGDGELRGQLEDLAIELGLGDSVEFLGERRDVKELLSRMDVFVLSSRSEGLPVALLEAMASGLIVVATRVGSIPEVIRPGQTGFLVEPGDPQSLASMLNDVVSRGSNLVEISRAARNEIRARYNFSATLEAYLKLYREVIAGV